MKKNLLFGGICICVESTDDFDIEPSFTSFICDDSIKETVKLNLIWSFAKAPTELGTYLGSDLLQSFYKKENTLFCTLIAGERGDLALTEYDPAYSQFTCYVNSEAYPTFPKTLGNIIRAFPIRSVFQHYGVLFFHASQIALHNRGILFTAPSGTGKTTQAKLWRDFRGARIICNDRTLIRDRLTYGFPMDGSEPVMSGEVHELAAIVVLSQSKENSVQHLGPRAALSKLLPQLVIDAWNPEAYKIALEQLIGLLRYCPVYQLDCIPDVNAVECLESQLKIDGVIS